MGKRSCSFSSTGQPTPSHTPASTTLLISHQQQLDIQNKHSRTLTAHVVPTIGNEGRLSSMTCNDNPAPIPTTPPSSRSIIWDTGHAETSTASPTNRNQATSPNSDTLSPNKEDTTICSCNLVLLHDNNPKGQKTSGLEQRVAEVTESVAGKGGAALGERMDAPGPIPPTLLYTEGAPLRTPRTMSAFASTHSSYDDTQCPLTSPIFRSHPPTLHASPTLTPLLAFHSITPAVLKGPLKTNQALTSPYRQSIANVDNQLCTLFLDHPKSYINDSGEPAIPAEALIDIFHSFAESLLADNPGLEVTPQILLQFIAEKMRVSLPSSLNSDNDMQLPRRGQGEARDGYSHYHQSPSKESNGTSDYCSSGNRASSRGLQTPSSFDGSTSGHIRAPSSPNSPATSSTNLSRDFSPIGLCPYNGGRTFS